MGDKPRANQERPDERDQASVEPGDHRETSDPESAENVQEVDIAVLEEEVAKLRDALLRTRAEMDNMEKRNRREMEKAHRFQLEAVMRDLLPVIDGLEQGLENAASEDQHSREGLSLTHKLLVKALEQHGLEVIDPLGEPFDPQWHEAMSMQPTDEAEPDAVLMVLQKGYRLHDRLLRAARVIVARAP